MDETSFLDHLVAHGRVAASLDALAGSKGKLEPRARFALGQLIDDLQKGSSYVEEAMRLRAPDTLMRLMKACHSDEGALDDISHAISLCSGTMACAGRVVAFRYGGVHVRIREGPLGDGLGARVWAIAYSMCRELAGHPGLVAGRRVLEIGAGTGLCGIVAARLGAARVVLTDYELLVLANLRTCMHLNHGWDGPAGSSAAASVASSLPGSAASSRPATRDGPGAAAGGAAAGSGAGGAAAAAAATLAATAAGEQAAAAAPGGQAAAGAPRPAAAAAAGGSFHGVTDAELFDDAESVDEIDFSALVIASGSGAASGAASVRSDASAAAARDLAAAGGRREWEAGNMEVRLLDWQSSLEALDGAGVSAGDLAAALLARAAGGGGGVPAPVPDAAAAAAPDQAQQWGVAAGCGGGTAAGEAAEDMPPGVPDGEKFSVILGNETMYAPEHAVLVAAVIAHRLAPGGAALLCSAVRFREVFAAFAAACAARGLRHRTAQIAPRPGDCEGGILKDDYEGGFAMIAVDWAHAPSDLWQRQDFV